MSYQEEYSVCVNTRLLNTYETNKDMLYYQTNDTFNAMMRAFKDELSEATCIEDIESDLQFETQIYIDRYSYDVDADDICGLIYKEYELKGAE